MFVLRGKDSGYAVGTLGSPQTSIQQEVYAAIVADNERKLLKESFCGKPDFSNVNIDTEGKLKGYCLNQEHPIGRNKARVFKSALGFTQEDAEELKRQIKEGVKKGIIIPGKVDKFGARYTIDIQVKGRNDRTATVETGWIVKTGETRPSLITAFVKKEKKNA